MAKLLGNGYMLWIESATAGTFNLIKGQGPLTINRNAASINLTTKDDSGYGSSAPGLRDLSIDLDIIPNLPDTNGYTRLEMLANAAVIAPFNIQIRKNGAAGVSGDAVFAGSVYGNLDSTSFGQDAGVGVKVKLTAAGAPTIDLLA
jgi:predicted secreted protein